MFRATRPRKGRALKALTRIPAETSGLIGLNQKSEVMPGRQAARLRTCMCRMCIAANQETKTKAKTTNEKRTNEKKEEGEEREERRGDADVATGL